MVNDIIIKNTFKYLPVLSGIMMGEYSTSILFVDLDVTSITVTRFLHPFHDAQSKALQKHLHLLPVTRYLFQIHADQIIRILHVLSPFLPEFYVCSLSPHYLAFRLLQYSKLVARRTVNSFHGIFYQVLNLELIIQIIEDSIHASWPNMIASVACPGAKLDKI